MTVYASVAFQLVSGDGTDQVLPNDKREGTTRTYEYFQVTMKLAAAGQDNQHALVGNLRIAEGKMFFAAICLRSTSV